jgi:threonine synthase
LLYGVWKGFRELHELGLTDSAPLMAACEPASLAPLRGAVEAAVPALTVPTQPTAAYAIAVTVNGYRGIVALEESGGFAVGVTDEEIGEAQTRLAQEGIWAEASSAAALAGLRKSAAQGFESKGPVVCINTSSGFKDMSVGESLAPQIEGTWEGVEDALMRNYGMVL